MTLIAGIKCRDGYIIASDTAMTCGNNVYQGRKIDHYKGEGQQRYRVIVAWSGDIAHAKMTSQHINEEIEKLTDRSLIAMRQALEKVVRDDYISHIGAAHLQFPDSPTIPSFSLIVALEAQDRHGVYATNDSAVYEIDQCEFRGTGQELAVFLAERLLIERKSMRIQHSTGAAVYMAKHIFIAAKKSASGVGGNTEILARLMKNDGAMRDSLFAMTTYDREMDARYLWGIDEKLARAFKLMLDRNGTEQGLKRSVAEIESTVQKVRAAAIQSREEEREHDSGRLIDLVELDDGSWYASHQEHGQPK